MHKWAWVWLKPKDAGLLVFGWKHLKGPKNSFENVIDDWVWKKSCKKIHYQLKFLKSAEMVVLIYKEISMKWDWKL